MVTKWVRASLEWWMGQEPKGEFRARTLGQEPKGEFGSCPKAKFI